MTFILQPHLRNDLIRLAPLVQGDFDALYSVASDPLIWEQHPNPNRYRREIFETYFRGALESGGAFCIFDDGGGVIGSSRYYDLDEQRVLGEERGVVCIGYTFIARSAWGRGYNRALKNLMLDHAFRFVDRAVFHVGSSNMRSRKAMEKLGGRLAGEIDVCYYGEPPRRNVIYEIARGEWRAPPPAERPHLEP